MEFQSWIIRIVKVAKRKKIPTRICSKCEIEFPDTLKWFVGDECRECHMTALHQKRIREWESNPDNIRKCKKLNKEIRDVMEKYNAST